MSGINGAVAKGFFSTLFDLDFRSFLTLKFLKLIYTVLLVLILLTGFIFFIYLLTEGGWDIVLGLVGAPIVTLLYLVITRIFLESIALFFRIGENTSLIAAELGGGGRAAAPTGGPGFYPPGGPGGAYGPGLGAPPPAGPPVS